MARAKPSASRASVGGPVGLLPGRETIGPLLLMIICPWLGLWLTRVSLAYGGSLAAAGAALLASPAAELRACIVWPTSATLRALGAFAAFELALMRLVPGKTFVGPVCVLWGARLPEAGGRRRRRLPAS